MYYNENNNDENRMELIDHVFNIAFIITAALVLPVIFFGIGYATGSLLEILFPNTTRSAIMATGLPLSFPQTTALIAATFSLINSSRIG